MGQTSGAVTCRKCGHINRAGVIFCEQCGTQLIDTGGASMTHALPREILNQIERMTVEELSDTVKVHEIDDSEGSPALFYPDMTLRLEIDGITQVIEVHPMEGNEYIFGRHDPEGGFMPEIDLLPVGGYRMGISRRHAALSLSDKRLTIRDLGSSNGTALNGNKLDKYEPHQLRDGDKLRLGEFDVSCALYKVA